MSSRVLVLCDRVFSASNFICIRSIVQFHLHFTKSGHHN